MIIGFNALFWILCVLCDKDLEHDEKLDLIYVRGLIWCFMYLAFIIIWFLTIVLLLENTLISYCFLSMYIISCIISDNTTYYNRMDKWLKDNRMTLLDIKKKYIV